MLSSGKCEHNVKIIGRPGGKYVTRYTVDMRVVPVVTEYRIYQNKQGKYPIPAGLWCRAAYGNRLRAFVVALYGIGVVSNDHTEHDTGCHTHSDRNRVRLLPFFFRKGNIQPFQH